jgi:hypothetical protein
MESDPLPDGLGRNVPTKVKLSGRARPLAEHRDLLLMWTPCQQRHGKMEDREISIDVLPASFTPPLPPKTSLAPVACSADCHTYMACG